MHCLLEQFNQTLTSEFILDYRNDDLNLEMITEASRILILKEYCPPLKNQFLIITKEPERCLRRNLDQQKIYCNSLEKTIIYGFECIPTEILPRFTKDSRWTYLLANDKCVGIITYEPANSNE